LSFFQGGRAVLTEALFGPSDFLIASAEPVSRAVDPFSGAMTAEAPETVKFSEYLAALEEKAQSAREEPPARNEELGAVKNGPDDEENTSVAEGAVKTSFIAETAGVARVDVRAADIAETAALTADSGDTDDLKNLNAADGLLVNETAEGPVLRLAEAAPGANGEDTRQTAEAANTEKKDAADGSKPLSGGGYEKAETAPKESGGLKPINAGDGIYIDEKTPEIEERLAAGAEVGEGGTESAAFHSKKNAAGNGDGRNADGANKAAQVTDAYTGTTGGLARTAEREKSGSPMADGEKKHTAERGRRNKAGERVEPGGAVRGGFAEQAAPLREAVRVSAAPEAEITVNLRGGEPNDAAAKEPGGGVAAPPAASFETLLARELNQNLNGDIVRQAQVLLREGGKGTIRLSLQPESLGKVKIRLEMTENKITGKIIVESGEALRAFEREMESLEQTFRGEGFDGASLSLELAEHREPGGSEDERRLSAAYAKRPYRGEGNGDTRQRALAGIGGLYLGAEYSARRINVLV
jgi:flagellar hook-length control protein FliK